MHRKRFPLTRTEGRQQGLGPSMRVEEFRKDLNRLPHDLQEKLALQNLVEVIEAIRNNHNRKHKN